MNAVKLLRNSQGLQYPGGPMEHCAIEDIVAVGKHSTYGDNVTRYWIRTNAGEYWIKLSLLSKEERAWFKRIGDHIPSPYTTRDNRVVVNWYELPITHQNPQEAL